MDQRKNPWFYLAATLLEDKLMLMENQIVQGLGPHHEVSRREEGSR